MLRDLWDELGNNVTKNDNDNYENFVIFGRQEIKIWTIWSFCQSWSITGRHWQHQSSWKKKFFLLKILLEIYYIVVANYLISLLENINAHKTAKQIETCMAHFNPLRRFRRFKFSAVLVLIVIESRTIKFFFYWNSLPSNFFPKP